MIHCNPYSKKTRTQSHGHDLSSVLPQALYRGRIMSVLQLHHPWETRQRHMTPTIPKSRYWQLRQSENNLFHHLPQIVATRISKDNTRKLLLKLADGELIESVVMFMPRSATLCLSSQAGCALRCSFCSTGHGGFRRNMTSEEILGQAQVVATDLLSAHGVWPNRIVFMGMGEPLLNFQNIVNAIQNMHLVTGPNYSWRKILISSVGIPEKLEQMASMRIALPAISLHAPNQDLRDRLLPGAAAWPLTDLITCLKSYPLPGRERLVIEYLMIEHVNDHPQHAKELSDLITTLRAKINLIPYNEIPEANFKPSSPDRIAKFYSILKSRGQTVFVRRTLGMDISAACGQLRTNLIPKHSEP